MKTALPLLAAIALYGCYTQQPITTQKAENNKTYQVQYLFEHDGCKVYRFRDVTGYVYFTNCKGETIAKTDSTEVRNMINKSN